MVLKHDAEWNCLHGNEILDLLQPECQIRVDNWTPWVVLSTFVWALQSFSFIETSLANVTMSFLPRMPFVTWKILSAIGTLLTFRSRASVDPSADNYGWWQVLPEAGNKIWTSGSCSATPPRRIHIAGYTPPAHFIYFNINLRSFDNNCVLLSNIIAMQTLIIFHIEYLILFASSLAPQLSQGAKLKLEARFERPLMRLAIKCQTKKSVRN